MLNRTLTMIALAFLVIALSLAGLGWYFYAGSTKDYSPSLGKTSSQFLASKDQLPQQLVCKDITQGCGNGQFIVRFDRMPHVMHPFGVIVELAEAGRSDEVHASFVMAGMEMGLNRYRLLQQADKSWHADVTLPVCIQGKSMWNLQIEFKSSAGIERYRLAFESPGSLH